MRYLLAVTVLCAFAPAAFALPLAGAAGISASKSSPVVQLVKHRSAQASHHKSSKSGKGGDNGIHPLVGSGDY
jgi:hypothetical protein